MPDRPVCLVFPFDLLSHTLRCLQLADAVRDTLDVRFADSPRYRTHVVEAGFDTFACKGFDANEVMECARRFDFAWIREDDIERIFDDQVRAIREAGATVVLGDTAPTLRMAAEITGVRHWSLTNGYMTRHYTQTRPMASAHPAAVYAGRLPPEVWDWMVRTGERIAFRYVHRPFRRIRRRRQLTQASTYLDELEGDLNFVCDLPEIFPQAEVPPDYRVIGPLYHSGAGMDADIAAFLDRAGPTVLATVGSTGAVDRLSCLSDDAFAGWNILIAGAPIPGLSGPNVLTRPFFDVSAVLDCVDLVVCHGGNGSILQALSHGIPVICLTSIFEQEWNARRVAEMGLGVWFGPDASREDVTQAIGEWMGRKNEGRLRDVARKIDVAETRRRFREAALGDLALRFGEKAPPAPQPPCPPAGRGGTAGSIA